MLRRSPRIAHKKAAFAIDLVMKQAVRPMLLSSMRFDLELYERRRFWNDAFDIETEEVESQAIRQAYAEGIESLLNVLKRTYPHSVAYINEQVVKIIEEWDD